MYTDEQRRSHIFDLQTFLRRIQRDQGYARPIAADGIFGPETAAAVRDFSGRTACRSPARRTMTPGRPFSALTAR